MKRIRVLVVEDSLTVRKRIVEVLSNHSDFEIVGEAEDGKLAIELCLALRPDVITLDMMMPVMSGLAATEYIMAHCPTPILIVSSSSNRGELFKTYEALAAGALDVLEKPENEDRNEVWETNLISTLKLISRLKVITHPRGRLSRLKMFNFRESAPLTSQNRINGLRAIGIGASTGGPAAVLEILKGLPASFPLPILLVIHISKIFGHAFAEWLDRESPLRVHYVRDGTPLPSAGMGQVLLAPPDTHLVLRADRLHLTMDAERHSCRPSIDVLFESMAQELGPASAACLLTGMGKDGAQGLLSIRQAGGITLAQDEATSVIFGMPREAILLGAAQRVLPLNQISDVLIDLTSRNMGNI